MAVSIHPSPVQVPQLPMKNCLILMLEASWDATLSTATKPSKPSIQRLRLPAQVLGPANSREGPIPGRPDSLGRGMSCAVPVPYFRAADGLQRCACRFIPEARRATPFAFVEAPSETSCPTGICTYRSGVDEVTPVCIGRHIRRS